MEEQEGDIQEKTWKSCCFQVDKEFVRYLTAISISYIVLGLAIYKLINTQENSADKSVYISLITLVLGIYTNPVKFKRRDELPLDERTSQTR